MPWKRGMIQYTAKKKEQEETKKEKQAKYEEYF